MQPTEVGLLGPGLTGEVRLDLLRYIHLAPHASNELPVPGRMGAAQASLVPAWMAVSREQNDHPLIPPTERSTGAYARGCPVVRQAGAGMAARAWELASGLVGRA